jgi:hypothetical protein
VKSQSPFAPGPCPYELDDGAYILGALAPAARAEYERHLATCPPCRDSIAQLAVLPGLLGRLDPATAQRPTGAPPSLLPRVLTAMRMQRTAQRRRRALAGVAGMVVAVAVAAIVGIGFQLAQSPPDTDPSTAVVFAPMNVDALGDRLDAQIGLAEQQTGTLITVRCLYHGSAERSWEVWLVVYPRNEDAESIGSWLAVGGTPVEISSVTHYSPAQIDRIELRSATSTLAWWSP